MAVDLIPWVLFLLFVFFMLALDLGVFHRQAHAVERREALAWSAVWIGMAIVFNIGVYAIQGSEQGLEWTTGYLIEKSLSVDNVFLFILIFASFGVPARYQHRVLFWGILGALVMRGALIAAGAAILAWFHFAIYVFGAFLIVTGLKFIRDTGEHAPELDRNVLVRLARRLRPVTTQYEGPQFFVRQGGVLMMTPLFLVLLLVESTDVVFAIDSIPAIYAVTDDPFIVFTSNVFAILGLRAMYFVLNGYLTGLAYLKPALAAILVFVGTKMLLTDVYKVNPLVSLGVVVGILTVAIVASWIRARAIPGGVVPLPDPVGPGGE
jgi:tellurite resistance protein TerC